MKNRTTNSDSGEKTFRTAIVGTGFISDFHIRVLKTIPGVVLTAVCDTDLRKAEAAGRRWGIPRVHDSAVQMLKSGEVDVVHILTPPALHAETALACLEAGCHVLIEKPLAVTTTECRAIKAAAAQHKRTACVNHNAVYQPAFQRLVEGVKTQRLGRVQHVVACANVPLRQLSAGQHGHWMFQRPGNIILEQAPHPLSQIQFLMGSFRTVSSLPSGPIRLKSGALFYDTWQISTVCERGTAQCFLSFGKEYFDFWLYVIGQDGSALVDLRRNAVHFHEKTRFMEPVEQVHIACRGGVTAVLEATRNLADYTLGFLKWKPPTDPFYQSMDGSIRAYYGALSQNPSPPAQLEQATDIIATCEAIAQPTAESVRSRTEGELCVG
jgi:predicted dehydrogenase